MKKILITLLSMITVASAVFPAYAGSRLMSNAELTERFGEDFDDEAAITLRETQETEETGSYVEGGDAGETFTMPEHDEGLVIVDVPYFNGAEKITVHIQGEDGTSYSSDASFSNNFQAPFVVPYGTYTITEDVSIKFDPWTKLSGTEGAEFKLLSVPGIAQSVTVSEETPEAEFDSVYVAFKKDGSFIRLMDAIKEFGADTMEVELPSETETRTQNPDGIIRVMFLAEDDWAGYNVTFVAEQRFSETYAERAVVDCLRENKYIGEKIVPSGTYTVTGVFVRGDEKGDRYPLHAEKQTFEVKAGGTAVVYVRTGRAEEISTEDGSEAAEESVLETEAETETGIAEEQAASSPLKNIIWIVVFIAVAGGAVYLFVRRKKDKGDDFDD